MNKKKLPPQKKNRPSSVRKADQQACDLPSPDGRTTLGLYKRGVQIQGFSWIQRLFTESPNVCGSPSIAKNFDVVLRFLEDLSTLAVPHLKTF
jgi:hypothetical protein